MCDYVIKQAIERQNERDNDQHIADEAIRLMETNDYIVAECAFNHDDIGKLLRQAFKEEGICWDAISQIRKIVEEDLRKIAEEHISNTN